jgi:hypothetical protein
MTLYLTIFDEEREVTGWVFGHYSDFDAFRDRVRRITDAEDYPTLMEHSDCDGEWSAAEVPKLRAELMSLAAEFRKHPPEEPTGAFEHTIEYRTGATTLFDCFHNVDGANLFDALIELCNEAERLNSPILFQ